MYVPEIMSKSLWSMFMVKVFLVNSTSSSSSSKYREEILFCHTSCDRECEKRTKNFFKVVVLMIFL